MPDLNLDEVTENVDNSKIDDSDTLPENEGFVNFERKQEIAQNPQDSQNGEIPKHFLFDDNGEQRTSADGKTFDPEYHDTDENGFPKLTAKGKLRKRRAKNGSTIAKAKAAEKVQQAVMNEDAKYRAMGQSMANSLIALGLTLGGEDFLPVKNEHVDERANMENAFADWSKTKNIEDIPPNLALTIVIGSYLMPRLSKPKQVGRIKLAMLWLRAKFTKSPKRAFDPNKKEKEE